MQRRLCGREQEYGLKTVPPFRGSAELPPVSPHFCEGHMINQTPFDRWRRYLTEGIIRALGVYNRGHCFPGVGDIGRLWLGNGAQVYIDYSSVLEMANAEGRIGSFDGLLQEKANELLLNEAAEAFRLEAGLQSLGLYKNNTGPRTGQGNFRNFFSEATFGSHQNYSYLQSKHDAVINIFADFLPAILPITGSGHIFRSQFGEFAFLLSPRANHILDRLNATTTTVAGPGGDNRAVVNLRGGVSQNSENLMDESSGLCRFHIISRDATRCEFQTWLVDMVTHLVLRLAEEGAPWPQQFHLRDPAKEMRRINYLFLDLNDAWQYKMDCGFTIRRFERIDLFDYNYLFLNAAKQLSPLSDEEKKALQEWERVLELLKAGAFEELVGELDWVTKRFFLQKAMARKGWNLDSVSAWKIDAEYHNISPSPEKSLFAWLDQHGKIKHLITQEEIAKARFSSPETRARSRGNFVRWCANNPELAAPNVKSLDWQAFSFLMAENKFHFGEKNNPFSAESSDLQRFFRQLAES